MFSFTLKGQTYNSELSGEAVAKYLSEKLSGNSFATSLVQNRQRWGRWTESQAMWAHKLVIDHQRAEQAKQVENHHSSGQDANHYLPNIAAFLEAVTTLKRVKLVFRQDAGEVTIKRRVNRGPADTNAYWVALNGTLCGKLNADGKYQNRGTPVSVLALLDELEENPKGFTAQHGKEHGQCCFCGLPLTDERSVCKGYGPICAGHYNLPWG